MLKRKVLLVDDSGTIRNFERMMLGETEFEFAEAKNGEEALFAAARDQPDLILLDVNMPKIDGFETLRRLRNIEALKKVPVIFITAHADEAKHVVAADPHADWVAKPLFAAALNDEVRKLLVVQSGG